MKILSLAFLLTFATTAALAADNQGTPTAPGNSMSAPAASTATATTKKAKKHHSKKKLEKKTDTTTK